MPTSRLNVGVAVRVKATGARGKVVGYDWTRVLVLLDADAAHITVQDPGNAWAQYLHTWDRVGDPQPFMPEELEPWRVP